MNPDKEVGGLLEPTMRKKFKEMNKEELAETDVNLIEMLLDNCKLGKE